MFQSYARALNTRRVDEGIYISFKLTQHSSESTGKLPKGKAKKNLYFVIDFNKGITILCNQCLA